MRTCGFCYVHKETNEKIEVPLKNIDIDVSISGFIAHVSSTLKYENNLDSAIEAFYSFLIDENSAVYKFEAEIEGRKIIAESQEKQQAKQTYDDAKAEGRTAVLLEEDPESGDIFKCTVGNVPPKTEVVVRFAYVQELQLAPEGTAVEFTLPCVFVPRYRPDHAAPRKDTPATASPSSIPYSMTFNASVTGSKVSKVTSENEKIIVDYKETETKVSLAKEFKFEHDLKLMVQYEDLFKPTTVVQRGNKDKNGILKDDILMLNFMPELKETDFSTQHEFIFIIDRSGSMGGNKIQNASETLLLLLKSLPTGCYFNICSFGSRFDFLFPKSKEYSEESLKQALELQKTLTANYGGTEILRPLQEIYKQDTIPTHTRQLLLLTDGEVSNTQEVIAIVKKNAQSARMFAIGIGHGASTSLVKGIARAGNGKEEFVQGSDRLQAKVMKIMKQAMQGAVREVTLDWSIPPEVKVTVIPEKVPSIFSGDKLIMYAIMRGASDELHGSVTLRGKVGDRPLEFELPLARATTMADSEAQPLHRLAAKAQIKLLEDKEVSETAEVDSAVFGKMSHKDLVVLLSTSANIISRHTSFVGVDKERGEQVKGPVIQTRVPMPVAMACYSAACYSDVSQIMVANIDAVLQRGDTLCALDDKADDLVRGAVQFEAHARKYQSRRLLPSIGEKLSGAANWVSGWFKPSPVMHLPVGDDAPVMAPSSAAVRRDIVGLVQIQGFHGNWELDQSLAEILGKSLDELKDSADKQEPTVWATILALAWLQVNFSANKDEWLMIEMKTHAWLASKDLKGETQDQLIEKAKKLNLKI